MRVIFFGLTMLASGCLAAGIFGVQAAETVCKGLANEVCASNSDCSWVKSYKAKSGKEVAGFCRKKPARTSSQPKQPDKS